MQRPGKKSPKPAAPAPDLPAPAPDLPAPDLPVPTELLTDLRRLIDAGRQRAATAVNVELVELYWHIGTRIRHEVLTNDRADYGREIIARLSERLVAEYGPGFSKRNLHYMVRCAEVYDPPSIVHAARSQLSWTHLRELMAIEDPLRRRFYTEMCRLERWSTRALRDKLNGLLYERTALAKRPEAVVAQTLDDLQQGDRLTPDLVFRDPYVLNFLGLPADYAEADLEAAILRHIEQVIMEMGNGFTFVARQKRMPIGPVDYTLDLLFFHRRLRALVAVELKIGRFDARDKGQLELYLRWLDKYERQPGENPPLGLILCAEKNTEEIELLELHQGSIRVAEYLTELPPREVLEQKLHLAIELARARSPAISLASPKA
jgi:predicted nuclease of restriction endonuclease-like (RecB) superfamily